MNVLVKVQVFKEIVFNQKKSALLLKILLPKIGYFALFAFLRVFSNVYEKLPPWHKI